MKEPINSLWVDGKLGEVQLLTIRSFQQHGHPFVLWTYAKDLGDIDCQIRDAREVLPENNIFYYKWLTGRWRFGGIAERLKSELLYAIGGWHVDLDVTCLQSFEFDQEYVLRPHPQGVVGNIIKAPAGCSLSQMYRESTSKITADNNDWELSFKGLCKAVRDLDLTKFIVDPIVFGTDEAQYWEPLIHNNGIKPHPEQKAVHWCGATALVDSWEPGSFYHSLLRQYGLA